jgi:hypothetical protein
MQNLVDIFLTDESGYDGDRDCWARVFAANLCLIPPLVDSFHSRLLVSCIDPRSLQ